MSYEFNGTTDRIDYTTTPADISTGNVTVSAWIWIDTATPAANKYIFNSAQAGGGAGTVFIQVGGVSRCLGTQSLTTATAQTVISTANAIPDTTGWHHVLMTRVNYNGTGAKLYVNGVETTYGVPTTGTGSIPAQTGGYYIGGRLLSDDRNWDGNIAELGVWNAILTGPQITALAAGDRPDTIPTNLVFYAPLEADPDDVVVPEPGVVDGATLSGDHPTMSGGSTPSTITGIVGNATAAGSTATVTNGGPITIPPINGTMAHVVGLDNGQIYYSLDSGGSPLAPASMTKLMTVRILRQHYTTLASLQALATVNAGDIVHGSGMSPALVAGDVVSLEGLLYLAMIPSDNNACNTIARYVGTNALSGGGGISRFITEMNTQAALLGMVDTTYVDVSGLSSSNLTTAEDMALLVQDLYDSDDEVLEASWLLDQYLLSYTDGGVPTVRPIFRGSPVYGYPGVIGGKGGSLTGIIYNLSILWEAPNGQTIAICVMGATTTEDIRADIIAIIDQLPLDYPELATPAVPFTPAYLFNTLGIAGGGWWVGDDTNYLWQDTLEATPVTADGQVVGKWAPKVVGADTPTVALYQGTATNKPTYTASGGKITLDGVDNFLTLGATGIDGTTFFPEAGQEFLIGARFGGTDVTSNVYAKAGPTTTSRTLQLFWDEASGGKSGAWIRGQVSGFTAAHEDCNDGTDKAMLSMWNGTVFTQTVNNSSVKELAIGTAVEETSENLIFGARTESAPATFMTGYFRDIVITNEALDNNIQRRLRDWLQGASVNTFADPTGGIGGGGGGGPVGEGSEGIIKNFGDGSHSINVSTTLSINYFTGIGS